MSDELLNRARELLALRDKTSYWHRDPHEVSSDMADTIRDLLAEVERLTATQADQTTLAFDLTAERDKALAEVERLTACLKTANAQAERFEREWYLRGDALETAEARLKALCDAEPVAEIAEWTDPQDGSGRKRLNWPGQFALEAWVPDDAAKSYLIPRPGMESGK